MYNAKMDEKIIAKGKLFELVQLSQKDGRVFELARRAPGVRVIIADKATKKLLLTKEFRRELKAWDYRLPGGKVFDTLDEYEVFRRTGKDILGPAEKKAKEEAAEEAGVSVNGVQLFRRSVLGVTIEWDLYIFEALDWKNRPGGQALEDGEQIEAPAWYDFAEVEQMILDGRMQEERVALVLLQWLKLNA